MHIENTTFQLSNDAIASKCRYILENLSALRTEKLDRIFIDMSLEELLRAIQKRCGKQTEVTLRFFRHHTYCIIRVDMPGEPCNVLKESLKGYGYDEFILPILDRQIVYTYSKGVNCYYLRIGVKPLINFSVSMLIALIAAILFGLTGRTFFSNTLQDILTSIFDAFSKVTLGLIRMFAVPLIFCGMINGITGCGNLHKLNEIGTGLLRRLLISMLVILSVTFVSSIVVFPLSFSNSANGVSVLQSVLDTLVSFFPNSFIAPFLNGDGMQTVLLAIFIGVILLMIGDQSSHITIGFRFVYDALMTALNLVNRLIPLLIFSLITNMIWSSGFSNLSLILRALGLECAIVALFIALEIFLTARKLKLSIKYVVKVTMPIFLKGFLTASAISAYPETENALLQGFKLKREDCAFGLSFATGIYGSANTVSIPLVTIFCCHLAGVNVFSAWVFLLAIQCFFYSLAIPSSTGGMLFVLSTIFTTFGIPIEYLAIGTPLLMLVDYPSTALRATATLLEVAREYGKNPQSSLLKEDEKIDI